MNIALNCTTTCSATIALPAQGWDVRAWGLGLMGTIAAVTFVNWLDRWHTKNGPHPHRTQLRRWFKRGKTPEILPTTISPPTPSQPPPFFPQQPIILNEEEARALFAEPRRPARARSAKGSGRARATH